MANEVLKDAQDIVLISPSSDRENYVFAVAPSPASKRRYFNATLTNPYERGLNAFNGYCKFNEETGEIQGSSFYFGLRFDKAIRQEGLWVPGVPEARVLDAKKKLTNGVYRDFGAVVYSDSSPNKDTAHSLITLSERELPIMFAFRSLDYKINKDADSGVEVLVAEKLKGIIFGREAQEMLDKFNRANSGAHRLDRDDDGSWDAYLNYLDSSSDAGRVGDWICGEAARADLKKAYDDLDERKFGIKIEELKKARQAGKEAFERELGV